MAKAIWMGAGEGVPPIPVIGATDFRGVVAYNAL